MKRREEGNNTGKYSGGDAGLNLCRNKSDTDLPKSDPASHLVGSPSSGANERRLC